MYTSDLPGLACNPVVLDEVGHLLVGVVTAEAVEEGGDVEKAVCERSLLLCCLCYALLNYRHYTSSTVDTRLSGSCFEYFYLVFISCIVNMSKHNCKPSSFS